MGSFRLAPPRRATRRASERGQSVVILALSAVVLIGMVGLVTDGSLAYVHRRQMQNAADSAALAGTAVLRQNPTGTAVCSAGVQSAAVANAERAARDNGVADVSNVTVSFTNSLGNAPATCADIVGVKVVVGQPYGTYFSGVLGIRQISAGAGATAAYFFVSNATSFTTSTPGSGASMGVLPIALADDGVQTSWVNDGNPHSLQTACAAGGGNNTNFATLVPPGTQTLGDAMTNGVTGPLTVGGSFKAGSGSSWDAAALTGVKARIDKAPTETWASRAIDSPRVVVLLIRDTKSSCGGTMILKGLVTVFIDSISNSSSGGGMVVHLIKASFPAGGVTLDKTVTYTNPSSSSSLLPGWDLTTMALID